MVRPLKRFFTIIANLAAITRIKIAVCLIKI